MFEEADFSKTGVDIEVARQVEPIFALSARQLFFQCLLLHRHVPTPFWEKKIGQKKGWSRSPSRKHFLHYWPDNCFFKAPCPTTMCQHHFFQNASGKKGGGPGAQVGSIFRPIGPTGVFSMLFPLPRAGVNCRSKTFKISPKTYHQDRGKRVLPG